MVNVSTGSPKRHRHVVEGVRTFVTLLRTSWGVDVELEAVFGARTTSVSHFVKNELIVIINLQETETY